MAADSPYKFESALNRSAFLRASIEQIRGLDRMHRSAIERRDAAAKTAIALEAAIDTNLKKIQSQLEGRQCEIVRLRGLASAVIMPPMFNGDVMLVETYDEQGMYEKTFGI